MVNGPDTTTRLLSIDDLDDNSRRFLLKCQELVDAGEASWVDGNDEFEVDDDEDEA